MGDACSRATNAGVISGAQSLLAIEFALSPGQREAVVSIMLAGAVLGALVGGWAIDHLGRRQTIAGTCVVFVVGGIIMAVAPSFGVLLLGRFVVGIGVAVSAVADCLYISEISPPSARGWLVTLNELGITAGFLLAYLSNFLFASASDGWRWMFGVSAIPAAIQGVLTVLLPPSPHELCLRGDLATAVSIVQRMHQVDQDEAHARVQAIQQEISESRTVRLRDLLSKSGQTRHRVAVGALLVLAQQFSGQPNALYYTHTIFQAAGTGVSEARTSTLIVGAVKMAMTLAAMAIVDRLGRRPMLLAGISALCLGFGLLSEAARGDGSSWMSTSSDGGSASVSNPLPLVALMLIVTGYSIR
jgi:MFS transporter, SP family, solute carrier family 2 (facilitated glucose transporter), member 12